MRVPSAAPPPSPPRPPPDPETRGHILREIKAADELGRPRWEAALRKLDSG